ncbi:MULTISPECIES: urea transporter [Sporosarcina]|uniref:urea transporter n=1 Tax=Sporosarcina TaxID=1569 RepID=UPI00129A5D94|nr:MULTISPECIES: urea transporter [Sporosarcina]GKV63979.1 urea transporter [Sporosarcina sp. NCCP-2331]GLB54760.1 urea transporter [Sporosarcina sp. NCCP-2378]
MVSINPFMTWRAIAAATCKGVSQVLFIENTMTGILILLAITVSSPLLGMVALLSSLIGTLIGLAGKADTQLIQQGLLGYSPVLTGIALTLFLTGPYHWIIGLFGAAVTALFTATVMHFMRQTEIPVLTFPFIIVSWITLLASYRLDIIQLSSELVPQDLSRWDLHIEGNVSGMQAMLNGIGQIFFLQNSISGVLLYAGLFWAGWRFGVFAIVGNVFAVLTAFVLLAEHSLIQAGLYGYNAILTILAVSVVFKDSSNRLAVVTGILGACIAVPLTAAVTTLLMPYGLPAFTMPFVLSTWLLLGVRKVFPRF